MRLTEFASMEKTKVAIIGLGTVGQGVAKLLVEHGDRTARHAGRTLWLEKNVVNDLKKARAYDLPKGVLSDKIDEVIKDAEIKVVAHLIGGLEPERTIMLRMLESGKDVVTANKALLAEHGPELFDRARELGRSIAFEASVAGGIPIITNISQCLSANQILSLDGILNGTTNFILSKMHEEGVAYADALKEAQRLGYAEADPTLDVDGSDAAQKLAILAHLAFGARVHWKEIPRMGIDQLDVSDVKFAQEIGYRIKLMAVAELDGDTLELHVSPTLVKRGRPLSDVSGSFNAIRVVGDAVGELMFYGRGAGQMPTASAVVADMIDTAVGRTGITFRTLNLWSQDEARVSTLDHKQLPGRYYLRFTVEDRPGVLAEIAGVLGKHQISIASVIQHEPSSDGKQRTVPLVIMTQQAKEGAAQTAVAEIDRLKCVRSGSVRMRVLD